MFYHDCPQWLRYSLAIEVYVLLDYSHQLLDQCWESWFATLTRELLLSHEAPDLLTVWPDLITSRQSSGIVDCTPNTSIPDCDMLIQHALKMCTSKTWKNPDMITWWCYKLFDGLECVKTTFWYVFYRVIIAIEVRSYITWVIMIYILVIVVLSGSAPEASYRWTQQEKHNLFTSSSILEAELTFYHVRAGSLSSYVAPNLKLTGPDTFGNKC